jgi:hypothetical protein
MAKKDAISQKPFWTCHNMVAEWMLQIQHTAGKVSLTFLNGRLNIVQLAGFSGRKAAF